MTGQQIKALRKLANDKQEYISIVTGYDQSFYSKVERGIKKAPQELIIKLLEYYGNS